MNNAYNTAIPKMTPSVHSNTNTNASRYDLRSQSQLSNVTSSSIFETGEPVRVVLRVRPLLQHEDTKKGLCCAVTSDTTVDCETQTGRKCYRFAKAFDTNSAQNTFFDKCGAKILLESCIDG